MPYIIVQPKFCIFSQIMEASYWDINGIYIKRYLAFPYIQPHLKGYMKFLINNVTLGIRGSSHSRSGKKERWSWNWGNIETYFLTYVAEPASSWLSWDWFLTRGTWEAEVSPLRLRWSEQVSPSFSYHLSVVQMERT